jgi:hypothetical protein
MLSRIGGGPAALSKEAFLLRSGGVTSTLGSSCRADLVCGDDGDIAIPLAGVGLIGPTSHDIGAGAKQTGGDLAARQSKRAAWLVMICHLERAAAHGEGRVG